MPFRTLAHYEDTTVSGWDATPETLAKYIGWLNDELARAKHALKVAQRAAAKKAKSEKAKVPTPTVKE